MKNLTTLTLALLLTSFNFFAQNENGADLAPKYSNEFLQIGVGARSLGMSNSVVATTTDITAGYWNPAGLLSLNDDLHVGLMHAEYFAGLAKYDYGAFAKKIDSTSAFGVSMIRFGVDDIPNTTELIDAQGNIDYDKISTFSAADYGFIVSYARRIKNIDFGANVKIVHRKVGTFGRSWGFGIDLGARYVKNDWILGATFRDVTTTFNAWSYSLSDQMIETFTLTGNAIPQNSIELTLPRLLLGVARKIMVKEKFSILPELDFDITFDGKRNTLIKTGFASIDPHAGIELGYNNLVFLRGGIGYLQYEMDVGGQEVLTVQPNIGIGVKIKRISLDYALTDLGDASVALYSNIFSLKFALVKPDPS